MAITTTPGISLPSGITPSPGISYAGGITDGGFGPSSISGLAIWLDAMTTGTITKDGSDIVTTWADKSGNGNDFTTATGIRKPKYIATGINSRPAIQGRYDGANASNLAAVDSVSMNYTAFNLFAVLSQATNLAATAQLAGKYVTAGNQREHRITLDSASKLGGAVSVDGTALTNTFLSSPATVPGTPFICDLRYTPTGPSQVLTLNGTNAATQANPASAFNGTGSYQIFSREGGSDPFAGYIGEYIFYTRQLSSAERLTVLNYLSARWGIALA